MYSIREREGNSESKQLEKGEKKQYVQDITPHHSYCIGKENIVGIFSIGPKLHVYIQLP